MDDKSQAQEQQLKRQELQLQLNEIENKLADLKARWPYHSVQPRMVAEREDLEEERERLLGLINSL
ncbi:hypothetical protein [Desulfosporosinus sp. SB140]|uniref:hypothetical protein n=1 Tax=Desulfosporosinus paludis TaxID=3115649 RepID=UPI00388D5DEB